MTEVPTLQTGPHVELCPPDRLIRLEAWGDAAAFHARLADHLGLEPPPPGRAVAIGELRLIWWEPEVWIARMPRHASPSAMVGLEAAMGGDGAATDASGGFARVRITGPGWRDLLMIGGVFDAESPEFAPGCVAGTVIHHLPVRLDVIDAANLDAYVPPSYVEGLMAHWTHSAARLKPSGA